MDPLLYDHILGGCTYQTLSELFVSQCNFVCFVLICENLCFKVSHLSVRCNEKNQPGYSSQIHPELDHFFLVSSGLDYKVKVLN